MRRYVSVKELNEARSEVGLDSIGVAFGVVSWMVCDVDEGGT